MIGAWACGLTGCYIPGSGWTLRSGLDVRTHRKPAVFVEMVDTRWDEWNRVAQCNVYGGGSPGVWSDGAAPYPAPTTAPASPAWSEQPGYPPQPPVSVPAQPLPAPLIPPVSDPPPPPPATAAPPPPPAAPAAPVETLPAAPRVAPPESSPLPPPEPKPAEAPSGPVAGGGVSGTEIVTRRAIPDEPPSAVRRADDTARSTADRRVTPAGGDAEPNRNRVQLGAPVVEELPEPYVPRNPLKAGAALPATPPPEGHTSAAAPEANRPGWWRRMTSPLRAKP
jgi:hypothetical protein